MDILSNGVLSVDILKLWYGDYMGNYGRMYEINRLQRAIKEMRFSATMFFFGFMICMVLMFRAMLQDALVDIVFFCLYASISCTLSLSYAILIGIYKHRLFHVIK